MSNFNTGNS